MKKARKHVNGYDIMRYWLNKYDSQDNHYIEIDVVQCFRCKAYSDITCEDIEDEKILKEYWNKRLSGFVKAHIIPHAIGGECEVSNLIFLCNRCNRDDLDINSKELYMNWLDKERKKHIFGVDIEMIETIARSLVNQGMTEEMSSLMFGANNQDFEKFMKENCVYTATISRKTYYETNLALMTMYIDKLKQEKGIM
ncbi:HNH endonuclease signature motif containing protein [Bacillus cereus]|uniref:HNH endonuclease 5 domain-containing protein n=1 Tax=Bacillus thuringiensis serovar yosoo TaxID=180848 RepID=A0A9X6IGL4_BACTU|nr:HNH endonuclease signature motif containing protein [Bacillus thuringiensis]MEB9381673.1 HNH endonuclease signature motif containing protein [Bacillus cereus]OTY60327.1 hypothetical protein BK746_07895 [Bacillus thuringiensis serovar yosoo]